jgi:hypothetical protein
MSQMNLFSQLNCAYRTLKLACRADMSDEAFAKPEALKAKA